MLIEVGHALRQAREAAGLTLRAVRAISANRFKPSAVGAYERGERAITLERFCELNKIYGVRAEVTLAAALGRDMTATGSAGDLRVIHSPGGATVEKKASRGSGT